MLHVPMDLRDLPRGSRLYSRQVEAYYRESYEVPLRRSDLKMHEIYLTVLGHLPRWARALIIARNFVVSFFGLRTQPAATSGSRKSETAINLETGSFDLPSTPWTTTKSWQEETTSIWIFASRSCK